jgi:hypothetical protein
MGPLDIRLYVADATKSLLGNSRILDLIPDLLRDPTRERRFLNVMERTCRTSILTIGGC